MTTAPGGLELRRPLLREMLSYGVIGVLSASMDALIFWLLYSRAGTSPQLANAIGIACGITLSFWLNRAFTFHVHDHVFARFAIFWAVGTVGLALSAAILASGLRLGFAPMPVKLVSIVIVAGAQFVLNRTVTYRRWSGQS